MIYSSAMKGALRKMYMPGLVAQGMSATKSIEFFKTIGISGRKTNVLGEYRTAASRVLKEQPIRNLKQHTDVPFSFMTETELRRPRKYLVVGDAEIFDESTGLIGTRKVSMYSDELRTKAGWQEEYQEGLIRANYQPGETVLKIDWYVVNRNVGAPH